MASILSLHFCASSFFFLFPFLKPAPCLDGSLNVIDFFLEIFLRSALIGLGLINHEHGDVKDRGLVQGLMFK